MIEAVQTMARRALAAMLVLSPSFVLAAHLGLFVGINEYDPAYCVDGLLGCEHDAVNLRNACVDYGDWTAANAMTLLGAAATKSAIRGALADMAAVAIPGDTVIYFQSSHGGSRFGDENVYLYTYADDYYDFELAEDLARFAKGVKLVVVVDACFSGGLFKNAMPFAPSLRRRWNMSERVSDHIRANRMDPEGGTKGGVSANEIGWITSADYDQYSFAGDLGSFFSSKFVTGGWLQGGATTADSVSFFQLYEYAKDVAVDNGTEAQCLNEKVLQSVTAGTVPPFTLKTVDDAVVGFVGRIPAEVTIPDGVAEIAESAFDAVYSEAAELTSVNLPASVKRIGDYAFWNCGNLRTVVGGNNLEWVGRDAFWGTRLLHGDRYFDGFESAEAEKAYWRGLELVYVGDFVVGVRGNLDAAWDDEWYEYRGTTGHTTWTWMYELQLREGTVGISPGVLSEIPVTSVVIPGSMKTVGINHLEAEGGKWQPLFGRHLRSLKFSEGVETVADYAFAENRNLATVDLPSTVRKVGKGAFGWCDSLGKVTVRSGGTVFDSSAFIVQNKNNAGVHDLYAVNPRLKLAFKSPGCSLDGWEVTINPEERRKEPSSGTSPDPSRVGEYPASDMEAFNVSYGEYGDFGGSGYDAWSAHFGGTVRLQTYLVKPRTGIVPLLDGDDEPFAGISAARFDGYVYTTAGEIAGSVQVKAARARLDRRSSTVTSKITAVVQWSGGKRETIRGEYDIEVGSLSVLAVSGRRFTLVLGGQRLVGTFGEYRIDGVLNGFLSRNATDRTHADQALTRWKGAYTAAFADEDGYSGISVTVGGKGKVKIAGTLSNGVKVSASSQLLVGQNSVCLIPVVTRNSRLAFNLRLEGQTVRVIGWDGAVSGRVGPLGENSTFYVDPARIGQIVDGTLSDYLPNGVSVAVDGTKWSIAGGVRPGKVVFDRKRGGIDAEKAGTNPSALKLAVSVKKGTFSGTFKVYAMNLGRLRATSVRVAGVVVDGIGYGTARVGKVGGATVMIKEGGR